MVPRRMRLGAGTLGLALLMAAGFVLEIQPRPSRRSTPTTGARRSSSATPSEEAAVQLELLRRVKHQATIQGRLIPRRKSAHGFSSTGHGINIP